MRFGGPGCYRPDSPSDVVSIADRPGWRLRSAATWARCIRRSQPPWTALPSVFSFQRAQNGRIAIASSSTPVHQEPRHPSTFWANTGYDPQWALWRLPAGLSSPSSRMMVPCTQEGRLALLLVGPFGFKTYRAMRPGLHFPHREILVGVVVIHRQRHGIEPGNYRIQALNRPRSTPMSPLSEARTHSGRAALWTECPRQRRQIIGSSPSVRAFPEK